MEAICSVPLPINLNCWKHHIGFIKRQIVSAGDFKDLKELRSCLLKIGESQMDLYLGNYSVADISRQTLSLLYRKKIFSSEQYKNWLIKDGKDYQLLKLKDKSVWTLRLGKNPGRYVHIHPGRYSPQTVRVKATTLKTAILTLCSMQAGRIESIETETINDIRKEYLNEPPLKSYSSTSGLGKMITLLSEKS